MYGKLKFMFQSPPTRIHPLTIFRRTFSCAGNDALQIIALIFHRFCGSTANDLASGAHAAQETKRNTLNKRKINNHPTGTSRINYQDLSGTFRCTC